jgi:hypothetical protein
MPKIMIEFGDDEQAAAREALEASRMAEVLREIDEALRQWLKYNEPADRDRDRLEAIRMMVPEIVREG